MIGCDQDVRDNFWQEEDQCCLYQLEGEDGFSMRD